MYEKEVMAGIGLLDRVFTGDNWRPYINREDLSMGIATRCILGQLAIMIAPPEDKDRIRTDPWTSYIYATSFIGRAQTPDYDSDVYPDWVEAYGFELSDEATWGKYLILKDTWLRLMDETDPEKES